MGFRNPIVAGEELTIPGIRSEDYVETVAGWRLGRDGSVQVPNLNVLQDLGVAGDTSSDSFHVGPGGLWLPDDTEVTERFETIESRMPAGTGALFNCVFQGNVTTPVTDFGPFTTETLVADFQFFEQVGHLYLVWYEGTITGDVAGDNVSLHLRFTRDGTRPTAASAALAYMADLTIPEANGMCWFNQFRVFSGAPSGSNPIRIGMFARRTSGTGTNVVVKTRNSYQTPKVAAFDIGTDAAIPHVVNLATDPDIVTAPDPVTYTKTYQPTWSRTYDGDSTTTFDDSAYCYQGYYSSDRGNTRSLVGYDYATIMSDLSGATVNSVKLTYKVAHTYYGSGSTIVIGGHNYTAKPSTWNGANVFENQTTQSSRVAGSTYTLTLPSQFGTNLKSGSYKGIAFGPGNSSTDRLYYAYLYGATQTGKPYLTISYTK